MNLRRPAVFLVMPSNFRESKGVTKIGFEKTLLEKSDVRKNDLIWKNVFPLYPLRILYIVLGCCRSAVRKTDTKSLEQPYTPPLPSTHLAELKIQKNNTSNAWLSSISIGLFCTCFAHQIRDLLGRKLKKNPQNVRLFFIPC